MRLLALQFATLEGYHVEGFVLPYGARTRTRDQRVAVSGTFLNTSILPGTTTTRSFLAGPVQTTDDFVGQPEVDHDFRSVKTVYAVGSASGSLWYAPANRYVRVLTHFPLAYNPTPPACADYFSEVNTLLEKDALAKDIIAGTNPSLPDINSATSTLELKDVPGLLHSVRENGFSLIRAAAASYVTWRFAIKPMVSDLRTLLKAHGSVDRRFRELQSLQTGRELRRRVVLGERTVTLPRTQVTLLSEGAFLPAWRDGTIVNRRWGTARWKATSYAKFPGTVPGLRKLSERLTYGFNSASALRAAWELFPWSWFIDYFTQTSTLLEASANSLDLFPTRICLMDYTRSEYRYSPKTDGSTDWGWAVVDTATHYQSQERKLRRVVSAIIPLSLPRMPIFTGRHWSILSALAALQLAPRKGALAKAWALLPERTGSHYAR